MFNILEPDQVKANPGDVLINAGACFPDLQGLKRSFDIMIFLDFCVGLEAAVLHNTLHCMGQAIGEPNPALSTIISAGFAERYNGFFPPDRVSLNDLQSRIQQSDLLRRVTEQFPIRPMDQSMPPAGNAPKPRPGESMEDFTRRLREYTIARVREVQSKMMRPEEMPAHARWEAMAASWEILNLMGLERAKSIPTAHAAHALPHVLRDASIEGEDQIKRSLDSLPAEEYTITKKYEELKSLLVSERARLEEAGRREALRIPPIAFDVLRRIKSLESVGQTLLEVRDEYRYARGLFTEWDEVLRSPDTSMKQKQAEERRIKRAWDDFMRPRPVGWVECCTALADRLELAIKVAEPKGLPDVFLYLAKLPETLSWRFYLRPLHATRDWYEAATLNDLHEIVSRHFGHDLKPEELRSAREYLIKCTSL